jgi:signal transduction histidine kinase
MAPFAALFVLVLAIIWGSIAATLMEDRARTIAGARQNVRNMQQMLSTKVLGDFSAALSRITGVEAWLELAARAQVPPSLGEIVELQKKMEAAALQPPDIRLVTHDGRTIPLSDGGAPSVFVDDREWFQGAMEMTPGHFFIGKTITARDTDQEVIPIVIRARENAYGIALIGSTIRLDMLREAVVGVLEAGQSDAGIVRSDGTVLFDSRRIPGYAGMRIPDFIFKDVAKGDEAITMIEHVSLSKRLPRVSAVTAFERVPLVVYSSLLVDELEQLWWARIGRTIELGGVATLIVLTLSAWIFALLRRNEQDAARIAEALAQTAALSRAKSDFMGRMSHELRTPLNAILGFSEMMIDPRFAAVATRRGDYARDIHHSGRYLLAMIDQILEVSKIGAAETALAASRVSLADMLRDCAKGVECAAKEAQVQIDVEVEPGAEYLDADPALLRQMILGLLSNAVKFNRPDGRVAIHAARTRNGIDISVADTGTGIPEAIRPHLFEPFGFGDSKLANEDSRGLCLGLAIVKMLVERHGGTIAVASGDTGTVATLSFTEDRVPAAKGVEIAA